MSTADVETKTAHFRVNGADFTRLVRDFMLSERPSAAWRLIAQGLRDEEGQGGAERYATGILDGKLKLVGNEKSLRILKDVTKGAKGYIKTLQYIYAGRVRLGPQRAWYRPYAEVVEFGPDDAGYASQRTRLGLRSPLVNPEDFPEGDVTTHADLRHWAAERVLFYGREGDRSSLARMCRQHPRRQAGILGLLRRLRLGRPLPALRDHDGSAEALPEVLLRPEPAVRGRRQPGASEAGDRRAQRAGRRSLEPRSVRVLDGEARVVPRKGGVENG